MDDKELNKRLKALMPLGPRRRGRHPVGLSKALEYMDHYYELRRAGISPWRAIKGVADKYGITPEHAAACRKMVEEADPIDLGMADDAHDLATTSDPD